MKHVSRLCVVLLMLSVGAQVTARTDALDRSLTKSAKLIEKGQHEKAAALLERTFASVDSVPAIGRLTLALVHNDAGNHEAAAKQARLAAEGADASTRARADAELALALAADGEITAELDAAVARLRRYLGAQPQGSGDGLRVRLCRARSFVPPSEKGLSLASRASSANEAEPRNVDAEIEAPRKIWAPSPFPDGRQRTALRGEASAQLLAVIDEDGCVVELGVVEATHPAWGEAVHDTVGRWVFDPARREAHPIAVYYNVTARYRSNGRSPTLALRPNAGWGPWRAPYHPGELPPRR